MQGTYTITKAQQARTYQSKYGDMVVWRVRLNDVTTATTDGVFELHKKPGNEPKPGDSLDVERSQEGEFDGSPFVRLFLAKPQNTGGGQSFGGGSRSDDGRGESIERQVAAKAAAEMASALTSDGNAGVLCANFEGLFDAVLAKIKGQPAQPSTNGGEVPADTTGLAPAPAGVGDDIPF